MKNTKYILILIVLELFSLFGDYYIKRATLDNSKFHYLMIGMFIYGFSAIGWYEIMREYKFVTANILHAVGSIVVGLILGIFVFKEKLNLNECIGIGFSILGLFFLMKK